WFLETAAVAQVQQQVLRDTLAGRRVSQAMNHQYFSLPGDTTLQKLVDDHILGSGKRSFVVERGDNV
ncbi:MAG TPA: hypothetical protein DCP92_00890, partial [Nitrospiraceae bacterium]|nr:hypothetical protein [Nitrospiraceae bacterium]